MSLKQETARHLSEVILPFWSKLRDDGNGGFIGYVGYDLLADAAAPRGCIYNSRILWFFSTAYTLLGKPEYLENARHAFNDMERFADPKEGGLYWMCAADGTPLDETKHTYNHAFAVYALAAYARASGSGQALQKARSLFSLIEGRMAADEGYLDAFDRAFRPLQNEKLSDNPVLLARGVIAEKTMNTLLHVMEAYTLLYEVGGDARVRNRLQRLLELLETKVYNPASNRLDVFFDAGMRPLIDMQSYGHDIEASWLWDLAADAVLSGGALARVKRITADLARGVLERALQGGSLLNECVEGKPDTRRIWWVQAETMVGMANLWQKTGDPALMDAMHALWRFYRQPYHRPAAGGEWLAAANPQGRPARLPVAEPWKTPYHNGRMCMEMMKRL